MSFRAAGVALGAWIVVAAPGCRSVFDRSAAGSAHAMPQDAERALAQAETLAAGGDPGSAIRVVEPFLDTDPEIVPIHRLYQDLRLRAEARETIVDRYRANLSARPSARALLLLARVLPPGEEQDALSERAVALAPEDPWAHYAKGYRERSRGRPDAAEASFARALEIDPDFPEALLEGGETAYLLHDEETATDRLERLHSLRPDDRIATIALSAVLAERQEFGRAEAVLLGSLERRPNDAEIEIALTSVLIDEGRFEEAKASLAGLAERFPKNGTVAFNRAVVAEIHERDYAKALALYEQYLALGGEDTLRVARWMEKIRAGDIRRDR
jgi:tetratricopeptide (TPR) repeat protein